MPNRNSYLCLALAPEVEEELCRVAELVEKAPAELLGQEVTFRAMERGAVHVTALFFGELLARLGADELKALHAATQLAVRRCGGAPQLKFAAYERFPPDKWNLVIARFEATAELAAFHAELREAARAAGFASVAGLDEPWVPHATLGKIGATKAQLGSVRFNLPSLSFGDRLVHCEGLRLAGEVPRRVWLDWEGPLQFVGQDEDGADAAQVDAVCA